MAPQNILIIGAGVAGPALATFLLLSSIPALEKPHITLLERSATISANGQNIDLRGAGVAIIRKLGLENLIRNSTTGEEGVQHVDEQNRVWGSLPAGKTEAVHSPTSDVEIMRGRLAEVLIHRCENVSEQVKKEGGAGVEFVFGETVEEIEQDGERVNVRFSKSGVKRSFGLVVGADGLQSRTRKLVWGEEGEAERLKRLGMYGGFFSIPKGDTDTMWRRWYHAPGRRGLMLRPDKQRGKTTAFMTVISEKDERLVEVARKGPKGVDEQKALLEEYFKDVGWESERVIREMWATKDFYYDMVAQVKMEKHSKGRVVLLGDAGYCASPISGMGTTLGLTGGYNLAGALLRHPNDLEAAFSEYEEMMRPTIDRAQKLFPGAPHSLSPETAWGIWIRHVILYLVGLTGLMNLLFRLKGPPASNVSVEDFGFKQLPEWSDI